MRLRERRLKISARDRNAAQQQLLLLPLRLLLAATSIAAAIGALPASAKVLVCWEHKVLTDIAEQIGVRHAPDYPSDEFDETWTVRAGALTRGAEHC